MADQPDRAPGRTPLSGLTALQKRRRLGYAPVELHPDHRRPPRPPTAFALKAPPAKLDWRDHDSKNFITPVRDQGNCAACVAFATLAVVEAMARIQLQNPS